MSEFGDISDTEMEEDWMDTRWAVPDVTGTSGNDDKVCAVTGTSEETESNIADKISEQRTEAVTEAPAIHNNAKPSTDDAAKMSKDELPAPSGGNGEKQLMSRMALNDHKAGMQGLDKERINQIIYETSKGSRFYENELKREKQTNLKIEEQARKMQALNENKIMSAEKEADKLMQELEETRDLSRTIMHVDMDAFYAAVEMRDNPELKHKPMAVGGSAMLSTSNYLARRYGVRAAMPGFIGKKLCPDLVIVPTNFAKYTEVSNQIREILKEYDPNFCPMSLDEAYLDLTNHLEKRKTMSDEERTFYQVHIGENKNAEREDIGDDIQAIQTENQLEAAKNDGQNNQESKEVQLTDVVEILEGEGKNEQTKEVASAEVNSEDKIEVSKATSEEDVAIVETSEETVLSPNGNQVELQNKQERAVSEEIAEGQVDSSTRDAKKDDESNKVTPEDTEVAEIDAKRSKQLAEQGIPVTFGLSAMEAVREIRFRIEQKTELTASAGIAPNMMLSKVCSDKNKPDGQYYIPPNRAAVMDFINTLPIRKIPGIGKVAEKMLSALDVTTCADLHKKRGLIYHLYSPVSFKYFMQICLGIGSTKVERDSERKSMSVERTFGEMSKPVELYKKLYELCENLSEDLVGEQYAGKTVTIKLKTVEFELKTRGKTINNLTNQQTAIYAAARELLRIEIEACEPQPLKLRLMGVRMSNLSRQEGNTKKQSTITKMFANQKGSPRKHKLPVDNKDPDIIPAKRPKLEEKETTTAHNQQTQSVSNDHVSPTADSMMGEVSEIERLSESADSESTDIYWPPKENGFSSNQVDIVTSIDDNRSEIIEEQPPEFERPDSRSVSSDEYFAKPQPLPMTGGGTVGAKARDTPTTRALIKAQGSEPISCPVCGREFKSRNMTHITSHIDRCLEAANQQVTHIAEEVTSESKDQEKESEELFQDDGEELFSSRESQILLSQEVKDQNEDMLEVAGEKDQERELEKAVGEEKVCEIADVTEEKEVEEGITESEKGKTEITTSHDEKAESPPTPEESEENSSVMKDSGTTDMSEDIVNTTSDEVISEISETTATVESKQTVQADSDKQEDGVTNTEHVEHRDGENTDVKENGLHADEVKENGFSEATTADMLCPVCNIVQLSDLRLFNLHVDRCLKKQETSATSGTGSTTDTVETTSPSGSVKTTSEAESSVNKENGGISYLRNITPRRPLRTGTSKSIIKTPSSSSSSSTLSRSSGSNYVPVRSTVSHRATHTSVTKVSGSEILPQSINDEETEMVCPLCNVALYNVSLTVFNQHVDGCLNRQTIRELIHEQDRQDYKRSNTGSQESQPSAKRNRFSSSQPVANPMKKIYSFFSKKS